MRGLRRLVHALTGRKAFVSDRARVHGLETASVHPTARFTVLDRPGQIVLGQAVHVGRNAELTAAGGGIIEIGDDTSLQEGVILFGHIKVGAHVLFGRQVFAASRGHNFRYQPAWLIRDQDLSALSQLPPAEMLARDQVVIEDDCWIGQGVVITPAVRLGRGAVIGANSVVTRDVPPYEVHGGAPARKIGTRLPFCPPARLDPALDMHIPYFYRGFRLSRAALAHSRARGVVDGQPGALLVLAAGAQLCLRGESSTGMRWSINGVPQPTIAAGPFCVTAPIMPAASAGLLGAYTTIELKDSGAVAGAEII